MGLKSWFRQMLRERYAQCFSTDVAPIHQACYADKMEMFKGDLPEWVRTLNTLRRHFYNFINAQFAAPTGCMVLFLCFDRESPAVKKLVTHTKRYERRCEECRTHCPALPKGQTAGPECFSLACSKACVSKQIYWPEEGPHLNYEDGDAPLPDWPRFSADSRNLRRELYPLLMNWVLQYPLKQGQFLFTSGLPCSHRVVVDTSADYHMGHHINRDLARRIILVPWTASQLPLDIANTDYDRVFMMRGDPGGHITQEEVPDMRNSIHEADNAIFAYSRFFPDLRTHMAHINDGDAISIGLLRTLEDFTGGVNGPAYEQWLSLRYKNKRAAEIFGDKDVPRREYVNLTLLVQKIENDTQFIKYGIQSPVALMVFLAILSGSDFFRDEFCAGIGFEPRKWSDDEEKRAKQTKSVWDTFMGSLDMFHHIVQYYLPRKSLTEERRIVIDEDLFAIFTKMCYTNKYERVAKGKPIEAHCARFKNSRHRYPSNALILRWARQIAWNLNYWANAFRNIYIDPYERHMDQPYWGYDSVHGVVNVVSSKQKPLDEVHKRHLWKRRQKQALPEIPEKRKKAAIDIIRGVL